jgi:phosphoribosylglycinamide formyltransferase 1
MIRLGVLVSGTGTNLQAILDAVAEKRLDAQVEVVVSNVAGAGALERARAAGVSAVVVDHREHADRRAFDAALVEVLRARGVEVVVLAGFPGVNSQKQALEYGVRVAGCSVHFVDAGTDTGPIIAQSAVPVEDDDDEESLRLRILAREHELLPRVLQWLAEGRVTVQAAPGGRARVRVRE